MIKPPDSSPSFLVSASPSLMSISSKCRRTCRMRSSSSSVTSSQQVSQQHSNCLVQVESNPHSDPLPLCCVVSMAWQRAEQGGQQILFGRVGCGPCGEVSCRHSPSSAVLIQLCVAPCLIHPPHLLSSFSPLVRVMCSMASCQLSHLPSHRRLFRLTHSMAHQLIDSPPLLFLFQTWLRRFVVVLRW
jgi:hypothetical protein